MIDIGFANPILIIANNASGSRELGNLYPSAPGTPGSPRSLTPIVFDSSCFSGSFNLSDSIADFLTNVLVNPFCYFSVYAFSNFAVDLTLSSAILLHSNLSALGQFLQDNFPALTADVFSALSLNVLPNYSSSTGCLLHPRLILLGDSRNPCCLLFPLLLLLNGFTTLFALGQDDFLDYPSSLGPFLPLPPLGNFTYD